MDMNSLDIPKKFRTYVREKAIQRATTRIVVAGGRPDDFDPDALEIVVKEEEEKIKSAFKEKGLLAMLALLGLSWFG